MAATAALMAFSSAGFRWRRPRSERDSFTSVMPQMAAARRCRPCRPLMKTDSGCRSVRVWMTVVVDVAALRGMRVS
jgi:hypothetical protein